MICAGIDAGSRSIKAVLFDTGRPHVIASGLADQGIQQERLASELFEKLLTDAGLERSRISGLVATGYGRHALRFADTTVTEITCHARGVHRLAPDARTIIEIGGQDSKVISLEEGGRVRDFAMNDRCAGGTGRFLEMVAARLDMNWEKLAELGRHSEKPAVIGDICVVFAETEIIGLLADGRPLQDVVAGVQNAIATRVSARWRAGSSRRRFISPAASRCWTAWRARWRRLWLVRSASRRVRNSPAHSAWRRAVRRPGEQGRV